LKFYRSLPCSFWLQSFFEQNATEPSDEHLQTLQPLLNTSSGSQTCFIVVVAFLLSITSLPMTIRLKKYLSSF